MEKKEDRRVKMTKRMLKEALTNLLQNMDIYHVSIRELCQQADINRTTFYKYYGSQFDLLADMENDLLDFLSKTITEHEENPLRIIQKVCEYMDEHLDFVRLIINNNIDPLFPQKLLSLTAVRKVVLKKATDQQYEENLEYLYNYLTYGAYRIICIWINKDKRESPEQIANLLMRVLQFENFPQS